MNKPTITFALALLAGAVSFQALALEKVKVSSVEPSAGIVEDVGAPLICFDTNMIPEPNQACAEPATLTQGSNVLHSIATSETTRIQRFIEQPDNSIRLSFTTKKITDAGIYKVTLPEGYVTFPDGSVNEAYTFEYTILSGGIAVAEPAPGYYMDKLPTEYTVTFPGVVEIIDNHQPYNQYEGRGGVNFAAVKATYTSVYSIEGNTVKFKLSEEAVTPAGTYAIQFWTGALTLVYEDGSRRDCGSFDFRYNKPLMPFPVLSFMNGDNKIYSVGDFDISMPDGATFGQFMRPPSIYNVDSKGEAGARIGTWTPDDTGLRGKTECPMKCPFDAPFATPGDYIFKIGKASFSAVGYYFDEDYIGGSGSKDEPIEAWNNCDYIYRFTINASPATINANLDPIMSELSCFTLSFPEAYTVELNPDCTEKVTLRNYKTYREVKGHTASIRLGYLDGPSAFSDEAPKNYVVGLLSVDPPLATKGDYALEIPENYFICDGEYSNKMLIRVTVDPTLAGVDDVEAAEDEKITVVDMNGVILVKDGDNADLMKLPAGLYIINGRPTMVR